MSQPRLSVLPPLPLGVYSRRPRHRPFPLDQPGCTMHSLGRHALWHGVKASPLSAGDEVLAPAYHHGSEIEALVRAGLQCRFYGRVESLEPDEAELEALVGPRTRALMLIHYLGFPQDVDRWRRWCDEHGLMLIEDAAQAWLASVGGRPVGSFGDISIFCLYKTFGVPDGGALLSRTDSTSAGGSSRLGLADVAGRHAAWLSSRSARLAGLVPVVRSRRPYSPSEDFALRDPARRPAKATSFLLPRVAAAEAASRRREIYDGLLSRLRELVPQPFAELPEGASPFVFPVETSGRPELLRHLASHRIEAIALWSAHHGSLPAARFAYVQSLRARLVGLPVHQELRDEDVVRMAEAVAGAA